MNGLNAGAGGDGWKLGGAIEADGGAGFAEASFGDFEILVGNSELLFESVELRIAEDFPPLAAKGLIGGLRGFPLASFLEGIGGLLLKVRRSWRGCANVLGADFAAGEKHGERHGDEWANRFHGLVSCVRVRDFHGCAAD